MSAPKIVDDIEQAITEGPKPRLCKLYKWQTSERYPYGFFLRQDEPEIREGIFMHAIRRYPPSAAYLAGLRNGDKVIEVNFTYLEHDSFEQVSAHVGEYPDHVTFLVACPVTVRYYAKLGVKISHSLPNIQCFKSPEVEPPSQGKLGPAWRPLPCPKDNVLCDAPLWNELNTTKDMSRYQSKWSLKSMSSTLDNSTEIRLDKDAANVDQIEQIQALDMSVYYSMSSPEGELPSERPSIEDVESLKSFFSDDAPEMLRSSSPVDTRQYTIKDLEKLPVELKLKKKRKIPCPIS